MEARQPKEKIRPIEKATLIIALASLLITLIYGYWGVNLSREQIKLALKQDSTSLDIRHFDTLLRKTDTVIIVIDSQLLLNKKEIINANAANKFRFIAALFHLGSVMRDKSFATRLMLGGNDYIYQYVNEVSPILEGQLNNPYLCQDTTMLKLWVNAFVHLNIVGEGEQAITDEKGNLLITDNNGQFLTTERIATQIDKLSDKKPGRNFVHAWDAINEAFQYSAKKMKNETNHFVNE